MISKEELDLELEKFTLEEVLNDLEKLDKLSKLYVIRQALAQVYQLEKQAEFFESMTNMNAKIDNDMIEEMLGDISLKDIFSKLTKS